MSSEPYEMPTALTRTGPDSLVKLKNLKIRREKQKKISWKLIFKLAKNEFLSQFLNLLLMMSGTSASEMSS